MTAARLAVFAATAAFSAAHAAGTLTVCTEGPPDGFDIAQYESAVTNDAAGRTLYDQLLGFKPGTTEVIPSLASSWEISKDGLSYTFNLIKNAKFTDGTPVNADAVIFSFKRQSDTKHPAYKLSGPYSYYSAMGLDQLIKDVTKKDDYTVVFTLSKPNSPFISTVGMQAFAIVSPAAVESAFTPSTVSPAMGRGWPRLKSPEYVTKLKRVMKVSEGGTASAKEDIDPGR